MRRASSLHADCTIAVFLIKFQNMWTKPYGLREGFLIGAGLIGVGILLELSVGPVRWDAFHWPVNGMVLAGFLVLIAAIFLLRKKVHAFQFIGTYKAAIPALVYTVVLTIIMGLTRQTNLTPTLSPTGDESYTDGGGLWFNHMLSFWPFVLIYAYIAVILGQIIIRRTLHFRWKRDIPFLLNHLGLFLAMTTATLGNADLQRLRMMATEGKQEWRAMDERGMIHEMPIAIELKKFTMETYDDGSPKRFASDIHILTKEGKKYKGTVEVNKPVKVDGWKIYQYGYDTEMGSMSQASILELVSDPWLPLVYTGIYMMLAGALCMFAGFALVKSDERRVKNGK